jgi:hypothetical protein
MTKMNYSQVIGASSNESRMEPPSSLESIAASHDAGEGDSSRAPAPVSSRDKAAIGIRRLGSAVRFVGQELKNRDRDRAARYAEGIAAGIEHLANSVDSPRPADKARKARPLPGTLAHRARFVGLVAARVLKRFRATALRSAQPASAAAPRPPSSGETSS